MRYDPNESYESWATRVQQYEHGIALRRIAKGDPVNEVLDSMSKRVLEKMMHPILDAIRRDPTNIDLEASKRSYEEHYLKRNSPRPDHVIE